MRTLLPHIFALAAALLLRAESPATGFQIAGLPNASYKDGEGFAGGANLFFFQYGDGRVAPYNWSTKFAFKLSTEGLFAAEIFYDRLNVLGDNSRFTIYAEFKRYTVDDYYGLGNATANYPDFIDPAQPAYKDKFYFSHKHRWPALVLALQIPFLRPELRHFFGLGFYQHTLESYSPPNKLREDRPIGFHGGLSSLAQYGLVLDTRDQEAAPQRGVWSEVLLQYAAPALGSDYEYLRLTLTDRRYLTLLPNVVYAQRLIFEPIFGEAPFYDLATINGSYERHYGLGGANSMRGIPYLLFVGQHKLLGNFELRFETLSMTILKQDLTFYLHTFVDAGRVWLKDEPWRLVDLHSSYGAGLHVRWKKDLVGAVDVGRSRYSDFALYISFRNLF